MRVKSRSYFSKDVKTCVPQTHSLSLSVSLSHIYTGHSVCDCCRCSWWRKSQVLTLGSFTPWRCWRKPPSKVGSRQTNSHCKLATHRKWPCCIGLLRRTWEDLVFEPQGEGIILLSTIPRDLLCVLIWIRYTVIIMMNIITLSWTSRSRHRLPLVSERNMGHSSQSAPCVCLARHI